MKKKVLIGFMGNGRAGGVDKYILSLISVLDLKKYSVVLLTKEMDFDVKKELNEKGIATIKHTSAKNPIKQYVELKELMTKEKFDVVYLNMSTAILGLGLVAAKKAGVEKRIVHSHSSGYDSENSIKRFGMTVIHNIMKGLCIPAATIFIACSEKAGEWMYIPKILKSKDYHVIHNTVSFDEFQFDKKIRENVRQRLNVENKKVLVHVAGFNYQKNHEFMIRVMNEIVQKDSNTVLFLLGSGKNEEKIRKQVKETGLEKYVVFLGQVDNVTEYLQAADIFVLPSRFEGYPISALEAQVCGMVCALSDAITRESKITAKCNFLPLKTECWSEFILKQEIDCRRKTEVCLKEFDNENFNKSIIKLWEE